MPAKYVRGLKCRECGRHYEGKPIHVCEVCFGPLEVDFDYETIAKDVSREKIAARDRNMWRYTEFLPLDREPVVGKGTGFTPLVKADGLQPPPRRCEPWVRAKAHN